MTMKKQILISTFFILLSLCLFVMSIYIALSAMNHSFDSSVNIYYEAPISLNFVNNSGSNISENTCTVVINPDNSTEFRIDGPVPSATTRSVASVEDITNSSGAEFYWFSDNSNVTNNANSSVWEEQTRYYVSTAEAPLWYEVPQTQIELYSTFLTPNCYTGTQEDIGNNTDIIISHQATSIPAGAFTENITITNVVIPNSVTSIGRMRF